MRALTQIEIGFVSGGNEGTAPSCSTVTDSKGNSATVCTCPAGTEMKETTQGNTTTVTCVKK